MSSDYVLQANVKVGQHLINITGSDTDEFKANLQWTTENAAGIVAAAVALEAAYQVGPLAQNTASVQVNQQQPQQAYQQAAAAPQQQYQQPQQPQGNGGAPAPSCAHGAMKLVPGGTSKNTGKAYNAFWACVADRANQCKSQNT